ncbi:uncharacterized protein LOC108599299 [Drosophila busckii]|uniref:uncharacterized protein LOC108599299 n=1 Tax=Drosophila busckii TaxID=30019 RepID=UPI00083F1386|nr:uncharacterized protein LOC108599299 [Drosophila busckii]
MHFQLLTVALALLGCATASHVAYGGDALSGSYLAPARGYNPVVSVVPAVHQRAAYYPQAQAVYPRSQVVSHVVSQPRVVVQRPAYVQSAHVPAYTTSHVTRHVVPQVNTYRTYAAPAVHQQVYAAPAVQRAVYTAPAVHRAVAPVYSTGLVAGHGIHGGLARTYLPPNAEYRK